MPTPLRCLLLEDSADDAELIAHALKQAGYEPNLTRVETEADYLAQLEERYDVIISDFSIPRFNGLRALERLQERKLDVPFILVSGTVGEDTAVEAMKRGAADYLLKDRLARLGEAVRRALDRSRAQREARQAEEIMRQSEHKYRHLFENLSEAAFLIDSQSGRILDLNRFAETLLNKTRGSIAGQNVSQLFPPEEAEAACWALTSAAIGGRGQMENARVLTSDGRVVPVRVSYAPVELYRRALILALMDDISERKQAEERLRESEARFRQLVEHVDEVFWITDAQTHQILYISPSYEKVWGRPSERLYESPRDWMEGIHPDDRSKVAFALSNRILAGAYDETYRVVRPDGAVRWIRDRAFPICNSTGTVYRVVGTAEDVTERRSLEEQFRQAQKMESIGQVASAVAHDFNNLLSVIQGHASILSALECSPAEIAESAEQISLASERAAALTRQLLLFSRKQVMQPSELDLNAVVQNFARLLPRLLGAEVQLRLRLAPQTLGVLADVGMLEQVLMNLAVNARDAMPGGGQLVVESSAVTVDEEFQRLNPDAPTGEFACFCVSDTGAGIPPDVMPRIFEPFFTTKEAGKGTGLGLATVYGIVRQHRGFIKVYSEPDQGTVFRIYLPALPTKLEGAAKPAVPRDVRGGNETILLVEDELRLRVVVRNVLERFGYRVLEAESGNAALELWKTQGSQVDLLFTDMAMPGGVSGRELATRLLADRPTLKVIYTSGYSDAIVGADLHLEEGKNFLQKPCHPRVLALTVRNCLDTP